MKPSSLNSGSARATSRRASRTSKWIAFAADERGQDLVEYALVAALVGLGAVISLKGLRTSIGTVFTAVGTALTSSV